MADDADDRAARLGIQPDELTTAEPSLTPGVIDALFEGLVRFEEALGELGSR